MKKKQYFDIMQSLVMPSPGAGSRMIQELFPFIFLLLTLPALGQWQEIPVDFAPKAVYPADSMTVWATCSQLVFLNGPQKAFARSVDGGQTWTSGYIPNDSISSESILMSVVSPEVAWVAYQDYPNLITNAYRTIDGGLSWQYRSPPPINESVSLFSIHFWTQEHGEIISGTDEAFPDAHVYRSQTYDGGITWTTTAILDLNNDNINCIEMLDADHIWVSSYYGKIYRTSDAGISWTESYLTPDEYKGGRPLYFRDNLHGLSGFSSDSMHITSDGGATWQLVTGHPDIFQNVLVNDVTPVPGNNQAWCLSTDDGTKFTTDNGVTWLDESNYFGFRFTDAAFISPDKGWGVRNYYDQSIFRWEGYGPGGPHCLSLTGPLHVSLTSVCNFLIVKFDVHADIATDPNMNLGLNIKGNSYYNKTIENIRTDPTEISNFHFVQDSGQTTQGTIFFNLFLPYYFVDQPFEFQVFPTQCSADTALTWHYKPSDMAVWYIPICFAIDTSNCAVQLLTNVCGFDTNTYKIEYRVNGGPPHPGNYYAKNPSFFDQVKFTVYKNDHADCNENLEVYYICGTSAAVDIHPEIIMRVSPNPAVSTVVISVQEPDLSLRVIQSATGKIVFTEKTNSWNQESKYTLDVSNWPPGIYFAETFDSAGRMGTYRFAVLKP
jgi:hypothetical protein